MTFTDRLTLWFHVAFVVFTIGPVTVATMASPRAIRSRNVPVLRYLLRMTRIFGAASLGVLAFGLVLAASLKDFSKAWLTVSLTLFVVALVLLVLIMRDQRRAITALEAADKEHAAAVPPAAPLTGEAGGEGMGTAAETGSPVATPPPGDAVHIATVERGRIASMAGVVSLIWLAILVLMVWNA